MCGFDYRITTNEQEYQAYGGPTLNYSCRHFKEQDIQLKPNGLLQLQDLVPCNGNIKQEGNDVQLFLKGAGLNERHFDIFAASFFLLTRYEEYFDYKPDLYGRFEASASLLFKHGLLERPLINEWSESLRQTILKQYPGTLFHQRRFSYKITIDIDQVFAFRHRGIIRNGLSFLKNTVQFNKLFLQSQFETLFLNKQDPFDTFGYLKNIQQTYALPFLYFINVGAYSKYDKNLPTTNEYFRKVLNTMKRHAEIGLHPSYYSNARPHKFGEEKKALEQLIDQPVTQSRQHYLKLQFPETYRHLMAIGITEEYSMGYASHPGFRAGTCVPFHWFDLQENKATTLMVYPVVYMENSFAEDLYLRPEEALCRMHKLTNLVRLYNGCHISIWHNSSVNDQLLWKGWKTVFETSTAHLLQ